MGLLRAAWSVAFRSGVELPDYMVVGSQFGDPATGWTATGNTFGIGGILAAGYWNNTWEFSDKSGYLK